MVYNVLIAILTAAAFVLTLLLPALDCKNKLSRMTNEINNAKLKLEQMRTEYRLLNRSGDSLCNTVDTKRLDEIDVAYAKYMLQKKRLAYLILNYNDYIDGFPEKIFSKLFRYKRVENTEDRQFETDCGDE